MFHFGEELKMSLVKLDFDGELRGRGKWMEL